MILVHHICHWDCHLPIYITCLRGVYRQYIKVLNPEIAARGKAEHCYRKVKGWYCWYTPRSHAIYNIYSIANMYIIATWHLWLYGPFSKFTTWLPMLRLMQSIMNLVILITFLINITGIIFMTHSSQVYMTYNTPGGAFDVAVTIVYIYIYIYIYMYESL